MRVLILTSSTGGGHNMRARSLSQWAALHRPHWEVHIHPTLETTHPIYRFGVELYNFIQKTFPRLHHIYFNYLEAAAMFKDPRRILGRHRFVEVLEKVRPDVIVSVHGSTNHGFFQLAHEVLGRDKVRCVTYCAEMHGGYGMSRHWVNPETDLFIGSLPETAEAAVALGMPREKIRVGGFMLHPSFYDEELDNEELPSHLWPELDLDGGVFTVILSTGANSANNHLRFLPELRKIGRPLQVIALCGHNEATRREVLRFAEEQPAPGLTIRALPSTDRMALLMRKAGAIVARPGSGTTNEAIQSGCPLIFNRLGGLMPQEIITQKFCEKHGLSAGINDAASLARLLREWIDNPELPRGMADRMRAARPRQHPTGILALLES
ncbi:MAG: glycosyltransferase [Verrucomicrobium sp.]|nr:glycosyltransferase [Verrucomicrobium sp.]